LYGSSSHSVANRTSIPIEIVKEVHKEFWGEYKQVRKWLDGQVTAYQRSGNVKSLTGRIRNEVLPGNEITNTPIQGTGAEIVLEAQNFLYEKSQKEKDICFMPRIQVHDDLIFCLPDNNDLGDYIDIIGKEIVKPRFDFVNLPLVTEARIGSNWYNLESVGLFSGEWYENGKLVSV
jgi:DNA polymerase I-like protein with 3'-5' exonuclease and polymerase domains